MSITRGQRKHRVGLIQTSKIQAIYDRLRKRSLRQKEAYAGAFQNIWDDEGNMDRVFEERIRFYNLTGNNIDVAHQAYVRGVRDALDAVEREQY